MANICSGPDEMTEKRQKNEDSRIRDARRAPAVGFLLGPSVYKSQGIKVYGRAD